MLQSSSILHSKHLEHFIPKWILLHLSFRNTKLKSGKSLVALAGIDPPPNQSGKDDPKSRRISKRGSPALRKTLFLIMSIYLQRQPADEPVYQFLDKKRTEGKLYKVYMIAAARKFLRIYYARVKEVMSKE